MKYWKVYWLISPQIKQIRQFPEVIHQSCPGTGELQEELARLHAGGNEKENKWESELFLLKTKYNTYCSCFLTLRERKRSLTKFLDEPHQAHSKKILLTLQWYHEIIVKNKMNLKKAAQYILVIWKFPSHLLRDCFYWLIFPYINLSLV